MVGGAGGSLGVDAPALVRESRRQPLEGFWILEWFVTLKASANVHALKKVERLAGGDPGHDLPGKQVLDTCRLPRASAVEHTGGDDRVHVRMKSEVTCPGVQHHRDPQHATESSLSELEQSLAGCTKHRLE